MSKVATKIPEPKPAKSMGESTNVFTLNAMQKIVERSGIPSASSCFKDAARNEAYKILQEIVHCACVVRDVDKTSSSGQKIVRYQDVRRALEYLGIRCIGDPTLCYQKRLARRKTKKSSKAVENGDTDEKQQEKGENEEGDSSDEDEEEEEEENEEKEDEEEEEDDKENVKRVKVSQ